MSGTTRTIQQSASTGSILAALGMAAAVLGAAAAIAWGSANLGKTTQPVAAPAPVYAPAIRDLGGRDMAVSANGLATNKVVDHGSSEGSGITGTGVTGGGGYHGFGNPADRPATSTSGSSGDAPAGRNLVLRAQ